MHAPMHVVELILMHKETCWNDSVINSIQNDGLQSLQLYFLCHWHVRTWPTPTEAKGSGSFNIATLAESFRFASSTELLSVHWESCGINLIDRTFQEKNSDCQHLFSTFNHLYVIQIWSRLETQPLANPASVCDLKPFLLLTSATQNCKHQYPSGACENVTEVTEVTNPRVWW